jgi:hypothetical protein
MPSMAVLTSDERATACPAGPPQRFLPTLAEGYGCDAALVAGVGAPAGVEGHGLGIQLETTPQPFGGRRWWFVCPRTGRRAAKLYLPTGAFTFASLLAYRLAYRSQRETTHARAFRRAFRLRGKLEGRGGIR